MKRQNFFILLELPFDPATSDPAQIKAAIHAKSMEWSRLFAIPEHKSMALEYIQLIPEIEEVMLDDEKRNAESESAKKIRSGMTSSFEAELRVYETKGFVYPREIKSLYEKYRPYGFDYPLVKRLVRVPITDIPVKESNAVMDILAMDYDKTKLISEHLSILRVADLYEFLGHNKNDSVNAIYNTTSSLRNRLFSAMENTSENNAKLMLCDLAIEVFENKKTKAAYDKYLSINNYPELNELIYKEYKESGYISSDILMRLVNFGIVTYNSDVIAIEEHIRQYCKAYGIDINISARHINCPVCHNISPRGTAFCPECSSPLEGNCPTCNTFFTDGAQSCSNCSFPVGKMGLSIPYIELARQDLLQNNWISATSNIHNIEKYWPNHKDLNNLKASLAKVKHEYQDRVKAIEDNVEEHKYYTAQKLVQHAQSDNFVVPGKIIDHINNTISSFEVQLADYDAQGPNSYDELVELSSMVIDSLDLNQLLSGSVPEPPSHLKCTVKPDNTVSLEWAKSSSVGLVSYLLVRKENSVPLTAFDGDVLYSGENIAFEDDTILPLKKYCYSVFSKRSNTYSNVGAINVSPIVIIPKIEEFMGIPADGSAYLSWHINPYAKQVKLWRTENLKDSFKDNPGELLPNMRIDSFTDTDLKNNHTYKYYAVGVYKTDNDEILESEPVSVELTPDITPIPVDQFYILATEEDDRYFVNWEGPEKEDILFFASEKMPVHNFGQIAPLEILVKKYEQIFVDMHLEKNGRFTLSFAGERYIFPVVVSNNMGTVGRVEKIVNLPEIKNTSYEIIGDQLVIKFDWPSDDIDTVTLAWREDTFPKSVDQKGNQTRSFTKKDFDDYGAIRVPKISKRNYYCRLFNTLENAYGKVLYSEGVNINVNNLPAKEFFYKLDYKTSPFSKIANIAITVSSNHIFKLPKAYLIAKEGAMPLDMHDGTNLFEIDREQDVAGSITYKYKSEKLAKNLYVRLFFENEKYYAELRPIPVNLAINNK